MTHRLSLYEIIIFFSIDLKNVEKLEIPRQILSRESSLETEKGEGRAKVSSLLLHQPPTSIHQPVISPGKHLKRREQKHYVCQPRVSRLSDSFTPESFVTRSTRFTFRQSEFPGRAYERGQPCGRWLWIQRRLRSSIVTHVASNKSRLSLFFNLSLSL